MALPRVFISSTYYDFKEVRNNICHFIKGLGYEPVLHEKSDVAYSQDEILENSCYSELTNCDIVVCIIGNNFGTKSQNNEYSITMNELETALKRKKKIYIFISKDIYTENMIYEQNKDITDFKLLYANDIKIHEYISELKSKVKYNVIEQFETTDEINEILKKQFAGLFQNYLSQDASMTEAKTVYDLQETADSIKTLISDFKEEKDEFFRKFGGTVYAENVTINKIKKYIGVEKFSLFIENIYALDEFMDFIGYNICYSVDDYIRIYKTTSNQKVYILKISNKLLNEDDSFKDIRDRKLLDELLIWDIEEMNNKASYDDDDDGFPY